MVSGGIALHRYAIWNLRERVGEGLRDGEVVVAVSLDIANAFNSLPWPVIRGALKDKQVYLRCILNSYLSDRGLSYIDRWDRLTHRSMPCGVRRVRSWGRPCGIRI